MGLSLLFLLLAALGAAAEASSCATIRLEAGELSGSYSAVCEEASTVHSQYTAALPTVFALCDRIEAEANGSSASSAAMAEDELRMKAMELRKKHLLDQRESQSQLDELLQTPLDTARPTALAHQVDSACTDQIGRYLKFRRAVSKTFSELFSKLEESDQALLRPQAEPRP